MPGFQEVLGAGAADGQGVIRGFEARARFGRVRLRRLVARLRANRDAHQAIYGEAIVEYRRQATAWCYEMVNALAAAQEPRYLSCNLPVPELHVADYDRAIRMLEMDERTQVSLSEEAYARLVDDDWQWREAFIGSTIPYTGKGAP